MNQFIDDFVRYMLAMSGTPYSDEAYARALTASHLNDPIVAPVSLQPLNEEDDLDVVCDLNPEVVTVTDEQLVVIQGRYTCGDSTEDQECLVYVTRDLFRRMVDVVLDEREFRYRLTRGERTVIGCISLEGLVENGSCAGPMREFIASAFEAHMGYE